MVKKGSKRFRPVCRLCGKKNLRLKPMNIVWGTKPNQKLRFWGFLEKNGRLHICQNRPLSLKEIRKANANAGTGEFLRSVDQET